MGYRDAGDAAFALIRTETYRGFIVFPCVFLYFRCVELALKAVLIHHGVSESEITRKLGHRISALIMRAETYSRLDALGISREDRQLLDRFSDDYADKWFEYPDRLWKTSPKLEELKNLAYRVSETIRRYKRKSLTKRSS